MMVSPERTVATRPRTPTTNGICCALRMMAACDVLPPCSAANAKRPDRGKCKASIGVSKDPIPIAPAAAAPDDSSGRPRSVRRRRSPTAATSVPRSRRYASSICSNFAQIASMTLRTAHSAPIRSDSIRREDPSTTSSSRSIIRCASRMRCPSCKCSASSRAESTASCASAALTASRRRVISAVTRSRAIRRSMMATGAARTRARPMAMPSDTPDPRRVVLVAMVG